MKVVTHSIRSSGNVNLNTKSWNRYLIQQLGGHVLCKIEQHQPNDGDRVQSTVGCLSYERSDSNLRSQKLPQWRGAVYINKYTFHVRGYRCEHLGTRKHICIYTTLRQYDLIFLWDNYSLIHLFTGSISILEGLLYVNYYLRSCGDTKGRYQASTEIEIEWGGVCLSF